VTKRRCIGKLLRKNAVVPEWLVTDDLQFYGAATLDLGIGHLHDRGRWKNNRAENSHQPARRRKRKIQRFKSTGSAQKFLFNPRRCLQHFQRPTPSHVSTITPRATHCGDGYVARGRRRGLKLPVTLSLRVLDTITRQCPREPCRRVRSFSRFPCSRSLSAPDARQPWLLFVRRAVGAVIVG
jgi:hypothetical protein